MSFSDIFKSSFLQEYSIETSTSATIIYLCIAAVLGFYLFLIYRLMTKKSFYNKSFNIALWVMPVITAAIIITISSNIILSLGMVGALSIVRYRTAIKDPMDLVFLFWALAEGIMCGAGMAIVGVILAVVVTIGIFILSCIPNPKAMKILTINASDNRCEDKIMSILDRYCKTYKVKSRVLSADQLNLTIEFSSEHERELTAALMGVQSVYSVVSLTHDGEVTL